MADIAEKLGISIVSVSKGLAGKDGVSEQMRAKILETAAEMGYIAPQSKKAEQPASGNVGILVADRFMADNAFYPALYWQTMLPTLIVFLALQKHIYSGLTMGAVKG